MHSFNVQYTVDNNRLKDLLTTGFEGGVGYWCRIMDYECPDGISEAEFEIPYAEIPLNGGTVICRRYEEETDHKFSPLLLNAETLQKGINVMSVKYPKQWADFLSEKEDSNTADLFLQCCFFGEAVYG